MKVVQVVTQMEAGGAQKVAHVLHEGLRGRGHETELWFLYTKRPAYVEGEDVRSLLPHAPATCDYVGIFGSLQRELHRAKPDVLISHTHYANLMAQVAARRAGVAKRIAVHHNPLPTYPRAARVADWFLGQTGTYSQVIAVSDAVADTAQTYPERYKHLLSRIYNGLPAPLTPTIDARSKWNIPTGKPLILNVGRLSQQKNQSALLHALTHIPDAHLAIVGDGELARSLRRQTAELYLTDRVHFTGELKPAEVFAFLEAADVFAFPSLFESMGLAVVEAMQMGVPIVAADLPALHEVLANTALFVAPQDPAALGAALRKLLVHPEKARDLAARARERARAFSADTMIEAYERAILS